MTQDVRHCSMILLITAAVGAVGFFGSHETSSFGLFADAAHIVADGLPFVGSLILAMGVAYEEQEDMVEDAIKWINRLFIAGSGAYVFVMGGYHLFHPNPVKPTMAIFAAVVLVGNIFQADYARVLSHLYDDHRTHRGLMAHLLYDIGVSAIVFLGGIAIALFGWTLVDPLLSIGLGLATPLVLRHIEQHGAHEHHHH